MRPHKLALTLVLLRAVRAAQFAVLIAGVYSVGHGQSRVELVATTTDPKPIPADTSPMPVPAPTGAYVPPPPIEPRTIDGKLDGVELYGEIAWATQTFDGHVGVVRSSDAGATWQQVGPRVTDSCGFGASGANDAFFLTCDQDANGSIALSSTHDGGRTWKYEVLDERRGTLATIHFDDSSHGTLVVWPYSYAEGVTDNRSFLFRTSDGGRSFTKVSEPGGNMVVFSDADHAFVLGDTLGNDEELRWSSDGGKTFAVHPALRACKVASDPVFQDVRGALVATCPAGTFVFSTTDAGATWVAGSRIEHHGEDEGWFALADSRRVAFVEENRMHVTTDGGLTWFDAPHPRSEVTWNGDALFTTGDATRVGAIVRAGEGSARSVATIDPTGVVSFAFSGRTVLAIDGTDDGTLVYRSRDGGESFAALAR